MKLKNIKLVLLDVDGVLIDSRLNMQKSWNKLLKEKYVNKPFSEYFKRIGTSFENILLQMGINKNIKKIKKEYFVNSLLFNNKIKKYKTVYNTLIKLQKKYKLAIVTSKRKKNTIYFLKKFFPNIHFSLICVPSLKHKSKPNPDLLNFAFKKLGIKSKNSIYVGDTLNDLLASKRAKTNFVLANYGYNNKNLKSKFKIKKFSDIMNLLQS